MVRQVYICSYLKSSCEHKVDLSLVVWVDDE
jgi:hypothetical protein